MPKQSFKSAIRRPSDAQVFAAIQPIPFAHCHNCGNSIPGSQKLCGECKRLVELGMRDAVPQFSPDQDTQPPQSYPASNHAGYSDLIPRRKFPVTKERA